MSKKIIITSIIAVIVVAGGVVGGLWFLNKPVESPVGKNDPSVIVPDLSEDYGACKMLTNDQIKTALGTPADNLGDGVNSGRVFSQGNTKTQNCLYSLATEASKNNFKSEVAIYTDQAFFDTTKKALAEDKTMTPASVGSHQGFFYSNIDTESKIKQFTLMFLEGLNMYSLSITQPSDTTAFDDASAKSVLTILANEAKLSQ